MREKKDKMKKKTKWQKQKQKTEMRKKAKMWKTNKEIEKKDSESKKKKIGTVIKLKTAKHWQTRNSTLSEVNQDGEALTNTGLDGEWSESRRRSVDKHGTRRWVKRIKTAKRWQTRDSTLSEHNRDGETFPNTRRWDGVNRQWSI